MQEWPCSQEELSHGRMGSGEEGGTQGLGCCRKFHPDSCGHCAWIAEGASSEGCEHSRGLYWIGEDDGGGIPL